MYGLCVHFPQILSDSFQNWRLLGSNPSKKIPSSVVSLIPGTLMKNQFPRRKDGCFRVSGNIRSRFLTPNVHVRASGRSPGYPEAVGGYPGLIRYPDHPAVNAKPRFRTKESRNSKNTICMVMTPGISVSMAEMHWATPRGIREAWEISTGRRNRSKVAWLVIKRRIWSSTSHPYSGATEFWGTQR